MRQSRTLKERNERQTLCVNCMQDDAVEAERAVDLHPFHIKLANGQNYNLAPSSRETEAERDLILTLIGER
jgi:hypothetical protein